MEFLSVGRDAIADTSRQFAQMAIRMRQMKNIGVRAKSVTVFIVSCAFAFIMLNGSAFAQLKPSLNFTDKSEDPATEARIKKIENEYKSKLKTIPDQEPKKSDPWSNLRSAELSKK